MIDVVVRLPGERWTVLLHLAVTCYHQERIREELETLGAGAPFIGRALELMGCGALDYGLTFSSLSERTSVMVIAMTSTPAEFQNSLQHEIRHLVDHIALYNGVTDSEEVAYLTGDINGELFPYVRNFLCDCCHYG